MIAVRPGKLQSEALRRVGKSSDVTDYRTFDAMTEAPESPLRTSETQFTGLKPPDSVRSRSRCHSEEGSRPANQALPRRTGTPVRLPRHTVIL
eukprot:217754-Hanusia_phi.AAC.2